MDRLRFGLDAELDPYQLALAKQTNDNNINEKMCRYMLCLKYKHADGSLHALGSAFYVMHGQRLAVTAAHVTSAAGTNQIVACYPDGSQSDVITLGEDRIADISVIKVDAPCPLPTVRHTAPNVGDTVYFLGFSSASKLNFTKGMVTSMEQAAIFTTDAYADNGFSGGPVFNLHMELVGMVLGGAGITNQHVRCVHVAKVLIRALEAATELHKSMGHTLHVPLRDLVQGPTFAIQNNGRPIPEGAEADEEAGFEYPGLPNTVVLRKPVQDYRRIGNTAIPLENDKVAASSDSPVEVSQDSNSSLAKSSDIESFRDGITPAKYLQAVGFPGQTTVAWEGPLKREELMGLTIPRTVAQVPFVQLPEQTLMQMLGEGFPDPKTSHWTPKSEVSRLMNATLPSKYQDLLRTRNQLFNMLVRAVVATTRSQRLVAEWHVKSWDETREAVEHNVLLVRRSDRSASYQDAKSSASVSTERYPSLHTFTPSPRLADLEAAIKVLEQDHHLSLHSSMDPATTQIDPHLAGLWPDMMNVFDGEGLHPRRSMSSTLVDSEKQNSHYSPRSKLSSSTAQLLLGSDDEGLQAKPSSPRADATLCQSVSFAKDPLHAPQCGGGWDSAKSIAPLENDKIASTSDSPLEVFHDSNGSLDLSSVLESFRVGNMLENNPHTVSFPEVSHNSNSSLDLSSVLESLRVGNTHENNPHTVISTEVSQNSNSSLDLSSEIESFGAGNTFVKDP
eukprot:gene28157-31256_t